jgi:hypothetical protein
MAKKKEVTEEAEAPAEQPESQDTGLALVQKPFTPNEQKLLKGFGGPGAVIDVLVPDDIDPKDFSFALSVTCRAYRKAEMQGHALFPILGRLLLVVKKNPEIIKDSGFGGFDAFLEGRVMGEFGVGRSTCYEAIKVASRFSHLTIEEHQQIGRVKFALLCANIPEGDSKKPYAKRLIEKAKTEPLSELRAHAIGKKRTDAGAPPDEMMVTITGTPDQIAEINSFFSDPENQAYAESGNHAVMLIRAIQCFASDRASQVPVQVVDADPEFSDASTAR